MKKFLVLISLLFVTVCYAAPPPDFGPTDMNGTELVATQDAVDLVLDVEAVQVQSAQEVAFDYIGYSLSPSGEAITEQTVAVRANEMPVLLSTYGIKESDKPPLLLIAGNSALNNESDFLIDRQHSNYGYPFSAN